MNYTKNSNYNSKASKALLNNINSTEGNVIKLSTSDIYKALQSNELVNKLLCKKLVCLEIIGDQVILKSKTNGKRKNSKVTIMVELSNIVNSRFYGQCMSYWEEYKKQESPVYRYGIRISPSWFKATNYTKSSTIKEQRKEYKRGV